MTERTAAVRGTAVVGRGRRSSVGDLHTCAPFRPLCFFEMRGILALLIVTAKNEGDAGSRLVLYAASPWNVAPLTLPCRSRLPRPVRWRSRCLHGWLCWARFWATPRPSSRHRQAVLRQVPCSGRGTLAPRTPRVPRAVKAPVRPHSSSMPTKPPTGNPATAARWRCTRTHGPCSTLGPLPLQRCHRTNRRRPRGGALT